MIYLLASSALSTYGEESVQDTFGVVLDVIEAKARTYMRNRTAHVGFDKME
jgi:hypothetical protein